MTKVDLTPSENVTSAEVTYANVDKIKKMQMKGGEDNYKGPPVPAYTPGESSAVEYKGEEVIEETYAVVNKKRRRDQVPVEGKEEEDEAPPIPPYTVELLDTEAKKTPAGEYD